MAQPWERYPGEGSKAFAAFLRYRDMGVERSISKVAAEFGKSTALLQRWSSAWGWVSRVRAWESEQDRQKRLAEIIAIRAMAQRQARLGQLLQTRGTKRLADMTEDDVKLLSIFEATRLIESGVRVERMARGEEVSAPADMQTEVRELDIVAILRANPARIGPVVELLGKLRDALPELAPGEIIDVTPVGDDEDEDEGDEEVVEPPTAPPDAPGPAFVPEGSPG